MKRTCASPQVLCSKSHSNQNHYRSFKFWSGPSDGVEEDAHTMNGSKGHFATILRPSFKSGRSPTSEARRVQSTSEWLHGPSDDLKSFRLPWADSGHSTSVEPGKPSNQRLRGFTQTGKKVDQSRSTPNAPNQGFCSTPSTPPPVFGSDRFHRSRTFELRSHLSSTAEKTQIPQSPPTWCLGGSFAGYNIYYIYIYHSCASEARIARQHINLKHILPTSCAYPAAFSLALSLSLFGDRL